MKTINKLILLLILLLLFNGNVLSLTYQGCNYSDVARLKSLVTNVNVSYDYHIINNVAYFDVTLNNIMPDIYFVDETTGITYTYSSTNNGEIIIKNYSGNDGKYKFYSAVNECYGTVIGSRYYKFPTYNSYYNDPLCEGLENTDMCQKWIKIPYSYNKFQSLINEYKTQVTENRIKSELSVKYEKNLFSSITDFYVNYYYYFLTGIIVICGIIIIVNRRNDKFKL